MQSKVAADDGGVDRDVSGGPTQLFLEAWGSMTTSRVARPLKGAAVTAVAVLVCHLILSIGLAAVRERRRADPGNAWAGTSTWCVTFALGLVIVMPLLLWAGMRLAGESHHYFLVIGGSLAWLFGAGYHLHHLAYVPGAHLPVWLLAGLVAVGAGLASRPLADFFQP